MQIGKHILIGLKTSSTEDLTIHFFFFKVVLILPIPKFWAHFNILLDDNIVMYNVLYR